MFGVLSVPLVSTAVYHRDKRAPWWLAAVASRLVVVGFLFPRIRPDIVTGAANRALSIVAVFVTAFLVHHERLVCEQLAEQTARAATADRVKAQLFNNLSHALRTPLSAITSASPICCFPRNGLTSKRRAGEFTPRGSSAALGRPE
jgi:K+-sensing histidine kinase KdpD